MRTYDFTKNYEKLLTPDIVALLTQIHEYKGEQALFIEAKADTLTKLVEIAKIQSTESSNKIEGIYTSDERLKKLVQDKTTPRTRNEQEIAGYRDVLATIHAVSYTHLCWRTTTLPWQGRTPPFTLPVLTRCLRNVSISFWQRCRKWTYAAETA